MILLLILVVLILYFVYVYIDERLRCSKCKSFKLEEISEDFFPLVEEYRELANVTSFTYSHPASTAKKCLKCGNIMHSYSYNDLFHDIEVLREERRRTGGNL